jgi:amino acid transporter
MPPTSASHSPAPPAPEGPTLRRELGLAGLAATGICSMMGAGINVIPFMIQRSVPGIGAGVLPAFLFAAVPAVLAALAYAMLSTAMPRAGGSYVYASRSLTPWLGFVASFSQWFGLSIAIGVVSYVLVPFMRDVVAAVAGPGAAAPFDTGPVRVGISLAFLWASVALNIRGLRLYERVLIPLMLLMFVLGAIVIVFGFAFDHGDFAVALAAREPGAALPGSALPGSGLPGPTTGAAGAISTPATFLGAADFGTFLAAAAILFASFIGFDSIAQAGGEARDPERNLPRAIGLAVLVVGGFYVLFTAAVYHAIPWTFIAERAQTQDLTAPGLLGYLLAPGWTVAIVAGAAIALINDLPAMLLAVSRLMFAWAEDGVFPQRVARIHPTRGTPHVALIASGAMATVSILGCHFAGDFFLGIDLLVISMLVNFLVMCLSVLALPRRNPQLASRMRLLRSPVLRTATAGVGAGLLTLFLGVHVLHDLSAELDAWYFHSTWVWLGVLTVASLIYAGERRKLVAAGVDLEQRFGALP